MVTLLMVAALMFAALMGSASVTERLAEAEKVDEPNESGTYRPDVHVSWWALELRQESAPQGLDKPQLGRSTATGRDVQ
eukprot:scaffold58312_cov36-Tisochrysis_lutea.AAC.1